MKRITDAERFRFLLRYPLLAGMMCHPTRPHKDTRKIIDQFIRDEPGLKKANAKRRKQAKALTNEREETIARIGSTTLVELKALRAKTKRPVVHKTRTTGG